MKNRSLFWALPLLAVGSILVLAAWRSDYYDPRADRALNSSRHLAASTEQTLPPHTEMFKFTSLHGSDFIGNPQLCKTCHGADLRGGILKSSCTKCHRVLKSFPHFSGDITETHGAAYLKDPAGCKGCHGPRLEGQGRAIGCNNCHSYPHSPKWSLPAEHGQAFIKLYHDNQIEECLRCHGKQSEFKKKFPDKFVACDQCHLEMPHPEGANGNWARKDHRQQARTYEGKCGSCHRGYTANLPRFKSCRICHGANSGAAKRFEPIAKYIDPNTEQAAVKADRKVAAENKPVPRAWGVQGRAK